MTRLLAGRFTRCPLTYQLEMALEEAKQARWAELEALEHAREVVNL